MEATHCPTAHELTDYLHGRLQIAQLERVAAHLDDCPTCSAALSSTSPGEDDGLLAALRQAAASSVAPDAALSTAIQRALFVDVETRKRQAAPTIRDYDLLELLGAGGMGAVYRARHRLLRKTVALKVLGDRYSRNPASVVRFHREMQAIGKLDHPHVVRATDAGEENGRQYLVMEYLDGLNLAELTETNERLSPANAAELIRQAAEGLQVIHQRGLLHRDLKPSNLMLARTSETAEAAGDLAASTAAPKVKILDLGLACLNPDQQPEPDASDEQLTRSGQVMGTPDYMAPETAAGTRTFLPQSDIYSLGATLLCLLGGRPPAVQRLQAEELASQIAGAIESVRQQQPHLPTGLLDLVTRMLAVDPNKRPASAAEVAREISRWADPTGLAECLSAAEHRRRQRRAAASAPTRELCGNGQLGHYQLIELCGRGGMGAVYRARHTQLDRIVAVKVLPVQGRNDPQMVARFSQEMKAVGRLSHPHIVQATDAGYADGRHYLAMEFVDGLNAAEYRRQHAPLAIADACEIARQAALALQHAHDHGLVHRDVKPANLMIARDGCVKLLDLGLAQFRSDASVDFTDPDSRKLTSDGQIVGTMDFMAPEQWVANETVDHRSDLWSLGATLHKLLTGQTPRRRRPLGATGSNARSAAGARKNRATRSLRALRPDAPIALAELVDWLLAADPAQRPPDAATVGTALAPFCVGHKLGHLPEDPAVRARPEPAGSTGETGRPTGQLSDPARTAGVRSAGRFLLIGLSPLLLVAASLPFLLNRPSPPTRPAIVPEAEPTTTAATGFLPAATTPAVQPPQQAKRPSPPQQTGNPDRDAAAYVQFQGGSVWLKQRGEIREWGPKEPLPSSDFEVVQIQFAYGVENRDLDLRRIQDLKELRSLHLTNEYSVTDADLACLQSFPKLQQLTLYGVRISDKSMPLLKPLKDLKTLTLRMVSVGDEGARSLAGLSQLAYLSLAGTDISDVGLAHVPLTGLRHLDLRGTRVTDAGLARLPKAGQLAHLLLGRDQGVWGPTAPTPVTEACVATLAKLPRLRQLTIEGDSLPGKALARLPQLTRLEVGRGFNDEDVRQIASGLPQLQWLNIRDAADVTDQSLPALAGIRSLQSLNLEGTSVGDAGLASLAALKQLRHLGLSRTRVTDRALEVLQRFSLDSLVLSGTATTHAALRRLEAARPACRIHYTDGRLSIERFFAAGLTAVQLEVDGQLQTIRAVEEIPARPFRIRGRLTATRASKALLDRLVQETKSLQLITALDLQHSQAIDTHFLHELAGLRSLEELSLRGTPLNARALSQLRHCRGLKRLDLSETRTGDDELGALQDLEQLAELNLQDTRITAAALGRLKKLEGLRILKLPAALLQDSAIRQVREALPDCRID